MKKIITAAIALALSVMMLVSCGSGVSVPYYILAMDNYTVNVFDVYEAVKETVTYYENGEKTFEYSIYMDKGTENAGEGYYNICESYSGYTFYGYNQELYAVTGGKTYAIIQADKSTYLEYVAPYEERAHLLDAGDKYQKYSKNLEAGREVSYYSKVSPLIAAELYMYGISETDRIISTYVLMEDTDFYLSVEYSLEHSDGTTEKIAERKFEYYDSMEENAALFAGLPTLDETVNVSIVYENGVKDTFKVPKDVYVGIDPGEENVSYYTDASFENAFDFENAKASENMTIYARNN